MVAMSSLSDADTSMRKYMSRGFSLGVFTVKSKLTASPE